MPSLTKTLISIPACVALLHATTNVTAVQKSMRGRDYQKNGNYDQELTTCHSGLTLKAAAGRFDNWQAFFARNVGEESFPYRLTSDDLQGVYMVENSALDQHREIMVVTEKVQGELKHFKYLSFVDPSSSRGTYLQMPRVMSFYTQTPAAAAPAEDAASGDSSDSSDEVVVDPQVVISSMRPIVSLQLNAQDPDDDQCDDDLYKFQLDFSGTVLSLLGTQVPN